MRRVGLAGSLACVLLMAGVATVQARSHVTGNDVPAMVQRTVAATLIVTPRQVDHDLEPNGPAATAGMEVDEIITASQRQAVCSRQDRAARAPSDQSDSRGYGPAFRTHVCAGGGVGRGAMSSASVYRFVVGSVLGLAVAATTSAADVTEIVVEANGLRPPAAHAALDAPVRFVNRTNGDIHIELLGDRGEHHVVNVPGQIWASFHRPGRHPFVVHVGSTGRELARGVVDVPEDPARDGLPVCGWITVEGICYER